MSWEALAALAGLLAAVAAVSQLWSLRRDALDARAAEITGVSLITDVIYKPVSADVRDGRADWTYAYTVNNPGRLPISDVSVVIDFGCEVRRRLHTGELEPPTRTLVLHAAVVPPAGTYPARKRRLSVAEADWHLLKDARIRLSFTTPDAGSCSTSWPLPDRAPSRSLRKRLRAA